MRSLPSAAGLQPGVALVDAQRVAAGRNEIDDAVERLARQGRVGRGRDAPRDTASSGRNGAGAGRAQHVLRQHVERARRGSTASCAPASAASSAARHSSTSKRLAGTRMACDGSSSRWLERPMRWIRRLAPFGAPTWMTRSTSPQSMPRSSVEVATTALQRAGRHRRLDLAALRGIERAVVQRDRQAVVVDAPQLLEQQLGLHARVDEHQRQAVRLDRRVDLGDRVARGVAGPRQRLVGLENVDLGLGAAADVRRGRPARCATAASVCGTR